MRLSPYSASEQKGTQLGINSFCIIDDAKQREKITEELCLAVKNGVKTAAGTHGCCGTEIPVI